MKFAITQDARDEYSLTALSSVSALATKSFAPSGVRTSSLFASVDVFPVRPHAESVTATPIISAAEIASLVARTFALHRDDEWQPTWITLQGKSRRQGPAGGIFTV